MRRDSSKISAPGATYLRSLLHPFIPSHLHDPIGLFARLIRSQKPDALFTIITTVLSAIATPADLLLQIVENRLYQGAHEPKFPIITEPESITMAKLKLS